MNLQDIVDYLIEAANEIINNHKRSDISFVLIGSGSVQEILARRVADMGIEENVLFTGRMALHGEMMAVLSACDISVQADPPNPLNDKSTMCKAMEYMALNKPVIAYDLKETRVTCGDVALYVLENSPIALADKILELADAPDMRTMMGEKGRQGIERFYTWSHSVPNLILEESWHHERPEVRSPDRIWYEQIPCWGGAFIDVYSLLPLTLQLWTPRPKNARKIWIAIKGAAGIRSDFHFDGETVIYLPLEALSTVAKLAGARRRRRLSEEHKAKLAEVGKAHHFKRKNYGSNGAENGTDLKVLP